MTDLKKDFYKMRLSTVVSIVFILHIHWVCGDSSTTVSPQLTEKSSSVAEKTPEIPATHIDDSEKTTIKPSVVMNRLLQNQQSEQQPEEEEQSSSIEVTFQVFSSVSLT